MFSPEQQNGAVAQLSRRIRPVGFATLLACITPAMLAQTAAVNATSTSAYQNSLLTIQQDIQAGDLEGAHKLLEQALRVHPLDGGLENLLGVVEIQQGHTALATRAFSDAIRHSPKLISAYLNLGRVYMLQAANDPAMQATALHTYERVLAFSPTDIEANYQSAVLLMLKHSYRASIDHIQRIEAQALKSPGVLAVACADEAGLGHRQQVESDASALAADPNLTEDDLTMILPTLQAGGFSDVVIRLLQRVADQKPLSAAGLRSLGLAQEATGDLTNARVTFERAFSSSPKSPALLVDLARVAHLEKDFQGALGYLAHARDLAPDDAQIPYFFGLICLDMNLLGESRRALGDAVRLAPENAEYNFAMGIVSSFAQDPTEALPYLRKFNLLRPENPSGILALGSTYFRAKDFDSATAWLTRAEKHPHTAAAAHYYLGRIARQQSRLDDAISELSRSLEIKPGQPDALAELGQVYVQKHLYPEAEKKLDSAIALQPQNYAANFGLLQLYARTSDPRREQQEKHFETIKSSNDSQYQEMMRVIEIRPQESLSK